MIVTGSARRMSPSAAPTPPDPVVLIISSAYNSLPAPGNRVGPSDASNMPTIRSSAATGTPAILTADGAHHYRLVGLNIEAHASGSNSAIVQIGGGETTLAEFPTDVTIDRCIVKGDDASATRRGVQLDAIRGAVVDSYIYSILDTSDSQAVWAYNTPGPLKVVNNYLEATGENMMFGGSDPSYTNSVPSDIEIRRNYFKKQSYASWAASWEIKNLLEFKNAQRVLVEGNYFDTNYGDAQTGMSLLVTVRNQGGTAPWSVTQDIWFRLNKAVNIEGGFNVTGSDDLQTSQQTYRISITDNLLNIADVGGGGSRRAHQFGRGPADVQMINNTWMTTGDCGFHENSPKAARTIWKSNVFSASNSGGIWGTATGEGDSTFSGHFTNHEFSYNVLYEATGTSYTGTGNQFPSSKNDVFTDHAGGDYTVKAAYQNDGHDGTDPGCDIAALNAAILHSVDGQWGSEHATYTDRTYTNAELPRTYIDTTYAAQSGNLWTVTSSSGGSVAGTGTGNRTDCSLAYALANCEIGDTISVLYTLTITGSFTLRSI